jgi:glutamine synthetase type III
VLEDRKEAFASLSADIYYIRKNLREMDKLLVKSHNLPIEEKAALFFEDLKPQMQHIRKHIDSLESIMPDGEWILPKYREMLFIS